MAGLVLDGIFAINKPVGSSSAQVIRDCQQQFNPSRFFAPLIEEEKRIQQASNPKQKRRRKFDNRVKMGHGGTLDPLATGVLILGVGRGTKSLQQFLGCTKSYETVVLFGASTDTYDRVGKILKETAYDHITEPMVREALKSFRGKIKQVPPLYSALKMEGKPLYEYAREGKPLPREIATREFDVVEMEMVEWYEPGTHNHRWPAEEATTFERNFAEQVWKIGKDQRTNKKLTPDEEVEETKALQAHENFKRKADENVDALIYDKFNKRRRGSDNLAKTMMSGALGEAPPQKTGGKGSNLVGEVDLNLPLPWSDKGPPAARIRMTVTSGFYVRSFCHDLGVKVGSAALMAELCRSRQGDFVVGSPNCLEYSEIEKGEAVWAPRVEKALALWNEKPRHTNPASIPSRALPVQSPKRAQKSVEESPPKKRKTPGSADEDRKSPSKTNSRPSARDQKHKKPENSEVHIVKAEAMKQEDRFEDEDNRAESPSSPKGMMINGNQASDVKMEDAQDAPLSGPEKSDNQWNGFDDDPKDGQDGNAS